MRTRDPPYPAQWVARLSHNARICHRLFSYAHLPFDILVVEHEGLFGPGNDPWYHHLSDPRRKAAESRVRFRVLQPGNK